MKVWFVIELWTEVLKLISLSLSGTSYWSILWFQTASHVISYTGILSLSIHTDNAITKEGFSANYSIRTSSDPPQPHQG